MNSLIHAPPSPLAQNLWDSEPEFEFDPDSVNETDPLQAKDQVRMIPYFIYINISYVRVISRLFLYKIVSTCFSGW